MLDDKVRVFLKQKGIKLNQLKLLVGVSGGPDSLALLHYLWCKSQENHLSIIAVHVDHMFRGEESFAESQFVKEFCREKDIPFEMTQIDVPAYIKESGKSVQVASRECRYAFFEEMMVKYNADFLALGHHGDDQVETILMRLTRGSSGDARGGISFMRPFGKGKIIRPFLCVSRQEIEDYCIAEGLEPRRDPSNEKGIYSRNRFRKEIMPFLKKENPQVHEHFQRFSEEIKDDEAFLLELTVEKMNMVIEKKSAEEIVLNINGFLVIPMPLQRRGIQLILNYLYKKKPSSLSVLHIEHLISLMNSPHPSGSLNFPNGLNIVRSYEKCSFFFHRQAVQTYRFELAKQGKIELQNGWTMIMEFTNSSNYRSSAHTLLLNREEVSLPLVIRTRQEGDRMSLQGMEGTKKVKDIFIDRKVPLLERKEWPIVTDSKGQILWVPGLKKFNHTVRQKSNSSYILLTYIKSNDLLGGTLNEK
ncbi:tRNA lysidine(34) synthetase TilS [Bacillus sp. Bva_UNVM-123]|uniref:tRNA lysidine(34) synthetase TilS n=1 Tax=Bacillus sp. Bva_UNVM-123 TaxID=2829798 RepID=UPI00391F23C5